MMTASFKTLLRRGALKLASLAAAGLVLGVAYGWAVERLYSSGTRAGFWLGAAHGALMPAALPSLVMGRDVPIFAVEHTGRGYKLGYIAGIDLCGAVFFGLAFRRAPLDPVSKASRDTPQ